MNDCFCSRVFFVTFVTDAMVRTLSVLASQTRKSKASSPTFARFDLGMVGQGKIVHIPLAHDRFRG